MVLMAYVKHLFKNKLRNPVELAWGLSFWFKKKTFEKSCQISSYELGILNSNEFDVKVLSEILSG